MSHVSVLLKEAVEGLNVKDGDIVVDATLGEGGHTYELAKLVGEKGKVISIDWDEKAIESARRKIAAKDKKLIERIIFVHDNFSNLKNIIKELSLREVDGILADLGWRSEQVDNEEYGLSFRKQGPLDMRLDRGAGAGITAADVINSWSEKELAEIFREYGEEKFSKIIAAEIIKRRAKKSFEDTLDLAEIIEKTIGGRYRKERIHPATRVFQALRIVVNKEFENLEVFLPQALASLKKGARLNIISFHSLEDVIVKKFFKANARGCICPKEFPVCVCGNKPKLKIITKKPIEAGMEELHDNPRARSAKLRIIEKI